MHNNPLISVITASLNQGKFIRHTIESVLAQGGEDWEHIVVDGGSTDETVSILESYPHLTWVSEKDRGQSDALNKAMKMSQGELIFWINSDDLLAPLAFDAARGFFLAQPDATIVCGNAVTIDEEANEIRRGGPRPWANQLRHPWNGETSMHQPSIVFRRIVYERVGLFDVNLHFAMDYDFFLRATRHFTFHYLPVDLGLFREYPGTKTGQGTEEGFREIRESLVRFVRTSGDGSAAWAATRAYFAEGCAWVNDAVFHYETGDAKKARRLLWQALLRYPPSLAARPHIRYRLIQLIGPEKFERIRWLWKREN